MNLELLTAFEAAKTNETPVYIEVVTGVNIITYKCKPATFRITETDKVYIGGFVINEENPNISTEFIEGEVFSFVSAEEIQSLTPRAGQIVYNDAGFGCVSTGVKDELDRLVVKTGNGTTSISGYTKSSQMHQG